MSEELLPFQEHINDEFTKLLGQLNRAEAFITKLNSLVSLPPLAAPPLSIVPLANDAAKTSSPLSAQ